jgi:hypothetical protein
MPHRKKKKPSSKKQRERREEEPEEEVQLDPETRECSSHHVLRECRPVRPRLTT